MTARGDDRKLMHWIASHGYTVVRAGSGHWKIFDDGVGSPHGEEQPFGVWQCVGGCPSVPVVFLHPLGSPLCRYERGSMG